MIVDRAIIFGERERFLKFNPIEHPVALQLGGNDPKLLSEATKIAVDFGYDEINLNVGCPSSRVKSGNFGAALMKKIDLVRSCVEAMKRSAGKIPKIPGDLFRHIWDETEAYYTPMDQA